MERHVHCAKHAVILGNIITTGHEHCCGTAINGESCKAGNHSSSEQTKELELRAITQPHQHILQSHRSDVARLDFHHSLRSQSHSTAQTIPTRVSDGHRKGIWSIEAHASQQPHGLQNRVSTQNETVIMLTTIMQISRIQAWQQAISTRIR